MSNNKAEHFLKNKEKNEDVEGLPETNRDDKFIVFVPQIFAAIVAGGLHMLVGLSLAYSAILVPKLQQYQNSTSENVIHASNNEISWIVSILSMVAPLGSLTGGIIVDIIGRLRLLKIAAVIGIVGWALIATATNVPMLIFGRVLTGIVYAWGAAPGMLYISEISAPKIRGSLISFGITFISVGMAVNYVEGYFMEWRLIAWICNVYILIIAILIMFLPESPSWLLLKGRVDDAKKSLEWIYRYASPNMVETQLICLQNYQKLKQEEEMESDRFSKAKMFFKPTVYKPLLILSGVYFFQQFSGLLIILSYAITFFHEVGTTIDPYLASVFIGLARLFSSGINLWLLRKFNRRTLIIGSGICMGMCMVISGLFTKWIQQGTTTMNWVPVAMIVTYIVTSTIGFVTIPCTLAAEMFPLAVRGVAHSIVMSVFQFLTFLSIQSYSTLDSMMGGSSGLQYFFAGVSFAGVVYCYILLPETHKKTPAEIEDYFLNNTVYCIAKRSNIREVEFEENHNEREKRRFFE